MFSGLVFSGPNAALRVIGHALRDWWRDWVKLTVLTLAWLVCWATVLLGPPATFLLYEVALEVVRGRDVAYRELLGGLRGHFLRSWGWLLAHALVGLGVWLNLAYYSRLGSAWGVGLSVLSLLLGALWLALQFYALPFLMVQTQPRLRQAWRNALFTLLASPGYSLVLLGFAALLLLLALRFPALLFLGLPALVAVLGTHGVAERLERFKGQRSEAERS